MFLRHAYLYCSKASLCENFEEMRRSATNRGQDLLKGLVIYFCCIAAVSGETSPGPARARSFNGVVAEFRIKDPVIKMGEDLRLIVQYKNTGSKPVTFRFFAPDVDGQLYRRGEREPIIGGYVGEFASTKVTLQAGASAQFDEVFNLRGWRLTPGDYEVRFYYHLALLDNAKLAQKYKNKYPHDFNVVPWEDRRHQFTITK